MSETWEVLPELDEGESVAFCLCPLLPCCKSPVTAVRRCLFISKLCDDQGKELVVNFVNLNYPDNDVKGNECRFRLIITSPQICQVRVDFVDTEMLRPVLGDCVAQQFQIEGSIWPTGLTQLCGKQNDQHFYLHLQPWLSNSTFIDFKLKTVSGGDAYRFGVWLTQIDCSSLNVLKAPDGCTQYFLGESGLLKSFNYEGSQYLNGQNYRICIRPGHDVCGVRYEAKTGEFGLRKSIAVGSTKDVHLRSGTGSTICGMDYVMIPDGKPLHQNVRNGKLFFKRRPAPAPAPTPAPVVTPAPVKVIKKKEPELIRTFDRFCGGKFSPINLDTSNQPIFVMFQSNMISLQVRTSGSAASKYFRQKAQNSTLLGYRLTYHQVRDCETNETDMVTKSKNTNLFQSLSGIKRPLPGFIFRDELIDENEASSQQMLASVVAAPDANSTLLHRFGNTSGNRDDENDSLWDYLDDDWEANGTGGDDVYDF